MAIPLFVRAPPTFRSGVRFARWLGRKTESSEQADGGPSTPASDVFALGLIFYEMLAGRRAFAGDNLLEVLGRVHDVDPRALAADVPEPFAPLLCELLIADPEQRTITMAEIARRLSDAEARKAETVGD